jgi:hypothetical protein
MDMEQAFLNAELVNFNHDITQNEATITRTLKVHLDGNYAMSRDSAGLWADLAMLDCDAMPKVGDIINNEYLPYIYDGIYFRCVRVHPYLGRENEILSLYVECVFVAEGLNFAHLIEESQKCQLIDFHYDTADYEFQTDKAFAGNDKFGQDSNDDQNNELSVPIVNSAGDAVLDGAKLVKPITTLSLTYIVPVGWMTTDELNMYNCSINTNEITICSQTISAHAGFMTVKNIIPLNAHGDDGISMLKFTLEIRIKQGNSGLSQWGNMNPPDDWDFWPLDQGFRIRKEEKLVDITKGMLATGSESDTTDTTPVSDPVKLQNGSILPTVLIPNPDGIQAIWLYYRVQRQYSWEQGKIPLPQVIYKEN